MIVLRKSLNLLIRKQKHYSVANIFKLIK